MAVIVSTQLRMLGHCRNAHPGIIIPPKYYCNDDLSRRPPIPMTFLSKCLETNHNNAILTVFHFNSRNVWRIDKL